MDIKVFGDSVELTDAPSEFVLLKKGHNRFTINGKQSNFDASDEDLNAIVKEFSDRGRDLVVDYDHATLDKRASAIGDAPAAGWLQLVLGEKGIVAKVVNWTKKAKERIANKEYRYSSPVIRFVEGRPVSIQSAGLTNHPAIHDQMDLVAANDLLDGTAVIDDGTELVLSNYEAMAKRLKGAIGELQTELKNILAGYNQFGATNENIQGRITSFSDNLFAEELKAFADVMDVPATTAVVISTPDQLKQYVEVEVYGNSTPVGIADPANQMPKEEKERLLTGAMTRAEDKIAELRALGDKITDAAQRATYEAGMKYLTDLSAALRAALESIRTVAMADDGSPAVVDAAVAAIMDNIRRAMKSVPMSGGKVLMAVRDQLNAMIPGATASTETVVAATDTKPVENPSKDFLAKFSDLGLTACSDGDELYKEVSKLSAAKKEIEVGAAKSKKEAEEKITALNDSIATLNAEKIVDSVISEKHGKITASMRNWAIKFAKRDPKGFEEHVANAPVAFTDISQDARDAGMSGKPQKKTYSSEQIRYARAFGNSPEEVYG